MQHSQASCGVLLRSYCHCQGIPHGICGGQNGSGEGFSFQVWVLLNLCNSCVKENKVAEGEIDTSNIGKSDFPFFPPIHPPQCTQYCTPPFRSASKQYIKVSSININQFKLMECIIMKLHFPDSLQVCTPKHHCINISYWSVTDPKMSDQPLHYHIFGLSWDSTTRRWPTFLSDGYQGVFSQGQSHRTVNLTTQLHLELRSNELTFTFTPLSYIYV